MRYFSYRFRRKTACFGGSAIQIISVSCLPFCTARLADGGQVCEGRKMAKVELDDEGLPKAGTKNPEGMFAARLGQEEWDMLRHMKTLWEAERKQLLTNKAVVIACIRKTYKLLLRELEMELAPPAVEPPLTPLEEYEREQTQPKKKKRYVRKS